MNDELDLLFRFPEMDDELVIALNTLMEELLTQFQNHYFAQIHRYYTVAKPDRHTDQMPLPLDDPPF